LHLVNRGEGAAAPLNPPLVNRVSTKNPLFPLICP